MLSQADKGKHPQGFNRQNDYRYVSDYLEKAITRLKFQICSRLNVANRQIGVTKREHRNVMQTLVSDTAYDILRTQKENIESYLHGLINHGAMQFAEEFVEWSSADFGKYHAPLTIYNHLVSAPSQQSFDFRKGALNVLAPTTELYLTDDALWSQIDEGRPVFEAVASSLKCHPATAKRITKNASLYVHGGNMRHWAKHLDAIDPSRWPQTPEEVVCFNLVVRTAAVFSEAFARDVGSVLDQWIRESKGQKQSSWADISQRQLARQIENQVELEKGKASKSRTEKPLLFKKDKDDGRVLPTGFAEDCLTAYKNNLRNIEHMKSDLSRKLVRAAVVLNLENRGVTITSADALSPIEDVIARAMWSDMLPSEQVSASGYWHSPRVNFQERFQSIAYSSNQSQQWATLFEEPLVLPSGIQLHPLNNTAMLREEADAMAHCVWSYSYNCMAKAYHIFSVRDPNGKRLTTLTVKDYFEGGSRKIEQIEHRGYHNAEPIPLAAKAADQLIDRVNSSKDPLQINWHKIDASKAEFLAQQVDKSVDYDFRNSEQRERIFVLYEPCLSRKILKKSNHTFDSFFDALGLDSHVDRFLASRESNIGGLWVKKAVGTAGRPTNESIADYNRNQPEQGLQHG